MNWTVAGFAFGLLICTPALAREVVLSAEQKTNLGIETVVARTTAERPIATLPALVGPARDSRIAVVAPFPGTVTEVLALEGQAVAKGANLGTVFSRDLLSVQSQLTQVQAELSVAAAAAERTRLLANEGVIAGARAQEADARASALRAQAEEQRHLLSTAQPDKSRAGSYVLIAPAAGRIARIDIEPGTAVGAMASAMIIDKADKLWLEAQLPADLIGEVKPGAAAVVGNIRGKVIATGMTVDPKTRSVVLRAEFAAASGFNSGSAVNMTLFAPAPDEALSIPSAALVRIQAKDTVFVATPNGFQNLSINVLGKNAETAVISGTIKPGQRVAVAGLSELKVLVEQD